MIPDSLAQPHPPRNTAENVLLAPDGDESPAAPSSGPPAVVGGLDNPPCVGWGPGDAGVGSLVGTSN